MHLFFLQIIYLWYIIISEVIKMFDYEPTIEDMDCEINRFIEMYDGTLIAYTVKNQRDNTNDDDYDRIKEIYDAVMEFSER